MKQKTTGQFCFFDFLSYVIRKKIFLSIILIAHSFIIHTTAFSQTFPFTNYSTKEGLCNANVFGILQDKNGYMWFTSGRGVSRFDGHSFQNFFDTDGLNSNSNQAIIEDSHGTIYLGVRQVTMFKDGVFSNYETDGTKHGLLYSWKIKRDTIFAMEDSKSLIYFFNRKFQRYFSDSLLNAYVSDSLKLRSFCLCKDKYIYMFGAGGIYSVNNQEVNKVEIEGFANQKILTVTEDKNNNLWIGCEGRVFVVNNNKVISKIEFGTDEQINRITKIFVDSRGIAWFVIQETGLSYLKDGIVHSVGNKYGLKKFGVMAILEDSQGNIWFTVLGKGVYCLNNLFITNFSETDGLSNNYISKLIVNQDGKVIIGTNDGLNILDKNVFTRVITGLPFITFERIFDIKNGYGNNYTVSMSQPSKGFGMFRRELNGLNFIFSNSIASYQFDSSTFILENGFSVITVNLSNKDFTETKRVDIFDNRNATSQGGILNFGKGRDSSIWMGTIKGLVKMKGSEKKYYTYDTTVSSVINFIKFDDNNRVWTGGNRGISVIFPDDRILSFRQSQDWDFRNSYSVAFDNANNVWVANVNGLYRIPVDSVLNNKISGFLYFNESNGLPSSFVTALDYDKSRNILWVGTLNGLAGLELDNLDKYITPPLKVNIRSIQLNDTILNNFENIELKPAQNSFKINYSSPNYSAPGNIRYEYKLADGDDLEKINWKKTQNTSVEFASMSPGNYTFIIRAMDNNFRSGITTLIFVIKPPFWKTIWFIGGIVLIAVASAGIGFNERIKYIKKKSQEKLENANNISELRHKALSASLNPHFIFNTLNSIQQYNNMHTKEEANDYFVNFSKLIRMNLDLAGNTFIQLEIEIERLELYLKYEKLRFGERLVYNIDIGQDINPDELLIPNMILQPFVENSIWHGLLPKKEGGNIVISINKEEKEIEHKIYPAVTLTITDNGIGLAEAAKHRKSKHISKGISIIKERLELLAPGLKDFEFIKIQDRVDNITGTEVIITLFPEHYRVREKE